MSETPKTVVNSWNEWDPLKHVIVGRADGTCIPAPEPALDAKVPEDSDMRGQFGPRPQDTVDLANEKLDQFAAQSKALGCGWIVRRRLISTNAPARRIGRLKPCLAVCRHAMFS